MDRGNSLSDGLGRLSEALEDPQVDLEGEVGRLGDELARAVTSYLGLTITINGVTGPVSLTCWRLPDGDAPVRSSLLVPLASICAVEAGSTLLLYAALPGAFVDLSADLSFALGQALPGFVLDRHLSEFPRRGAGPELTGLVAFSHVNQAVGVLVGCGRSHDQAHAELRNRAIHADGDIHTAAQGVINSAGLGIGPYLF
jgi:hypothetical protein